MERMSVTPDSDDEEILTLFGNGLSMSGIAARKAWSPFRVRTRLLRYMNSQELQESIRLIRENREARQKANKTKRAREYAKVWPGRAPEAVRLYRDEDWTLQRIGDKYGVSRERVRQWIVASGAKVKSLKAERTPTLELVEPLTECVACLGTIWRDCGLNKRRAENPTCGPECHQDFVTARYYLSDKERDKQRISSAKSALKRPQAFSQAQLRSWRRLLAGKPPAYTWRRAEPTPGTKVRAAWDRIMAKRAKALGVRVADPEAQESSRVAPAGS
jgi:hypothetical protein